MHTTTYVPRVTVVHKVCLLRLLFGCLFLCHFLCRVCLFLCVFFCVSFRFTPVLSFTHIGSSSLVWSPSPVHFNIVQAGRPKKSFLFGHLFFNITNAFCAKKRVGHACIPQDGHCLASFEVTPPLPQKVSFSAAKQNENSPLKTGCARPLLKKKIRPIFSFCFGCFCWRFCHADVDSREQQAILLKKVEKIRPKLRFSCFSGENFGTILSRRSRLSRTSRAPSRLSRPRPIDCDVGRDRQTKISRFLRRKSI